MKKVLYLLLVLSLSIGFASCSSDDDKDITPYLNIEDETIKIPYNSWTATIKIKTNEDWTIINNSDWGKIENKSGRGDVSILFSCWSNESSKERKATITIKTATFNKEVLIIQSGNNNFKQGTFAIVKSSTVYAKNYHYGVYNPPYSGYISLPIYTGGVSYDTELSYKGNRDKKPVLEVCLSIKAQITSTSWMTILLEDSKENMTIDEAVTSFLGPHYIAVGHNPYSGKATNSNVTNDNLIISKSGNVVTYQFNNFRTVYNEAWSHILDGKMEFELIE
jgi:hypothetical protein